MRPGRCLRRSLTSSQIGRSRPQPGSRCVTPKLLTAGEALLRGTNPLHVSIRLEVFCQGAAFLARDGEPGEGEILRTDPAEMFASVRIADALEVIATLVEEAAAPPKARWVGRMRGTLAARLKPLIAR